MQLNPAEISELIKSRIEGLGASTDIRNQGTVVSVTDGIVRVHGLSDAMQGEMLEFPADASGVPTYGLALNLERDSDGAEALPAGDPELTALARNQRAWEDHQQVSGEAVSVFNQSVNGYNHAITQFPAVVLAYFFGYRAAEVL